jgi:hypothetical protein
MQSYNRYSYVMNNPLAYTDPSGYLSIFGIKILPGLFNNNNARTVVAVAAAWYLGPAGINVAGNAFASSLIAGAASGAISTGTIQGAFQGAFTAGLFYGAGSFAEGMGGKGAWADGVIGRGLVHAAAGCIGASAAGGNCSSGALSAGFAEVAGGNIKFNSVEANLITRSVIGGTASVISGGKFANGATTAAFGYLFNYCSHAKCTSKLEQAMYDYWPGYKAGTLLYNQTIGDGSWTGWEVVDAVSVGASVAGKGLQALQSLRAGATGIEFGANANQASHAFRHIDDLGLTRDAVATAIRTDMSGASLQVGQGVTRGVTVNGVDLTYRAHRINESVINIGRITGPKP